MVAREKPGQANIRRNAVRTVIATCQTCGHQADVNVDAWPETIEVPEEAGSSDAASAEGGVSINMIRRRRSP
jgi:hypothetical protein